MDLLWWFVDSCLGYAPAVAKFGLWLGLRFVGVVAMILLVAVALGLIWDACTRPRGGQATSVHVGGVPVRPLMRRDSWYGRLYRRAYGEDRGWIVWLRALSGATGFEPPTPNVLPQDAPLHERVLERYNYEQRYQDAYDRMCAFLAMPPFEQPFYADAPRGNLCPTFWRIIFACYAYVLIGTLLRLIAWTVVTFFRVLWAVITMFARGIRGIFRLGVALFQWIRERGGTQLAYVGTAAAYACLVFLLTHAAISASGHFLRLTGERPYITASDRVRMAAEAVAEERVEAARKYALVEDLVHGCQTQYRWDVEGGFIRPDAEACTPSVDESPDVASEEFCFRNSGATAFIRRVENNGIGGACRIPILDRWENNELTEKWQREDGKFWQEISDRVLMKLRVAFGRELTAEKERHLARLAAAERKQRDIVASTAAKIRTKVRVGGASNAYEELIRDCEITSDGRWIARRDGGTLNDAVCAILAGSVFRDDVRAVQSRIAWEKRWKMVGSILSGLASVLGWVAVIALILGAIIGCGWLFVKFLDRFAPVLGQLLRTTVRVLTAPFWLTYDYVVVPIAAAVERVLVAFWAAAWFVRIRASVRRAILGIRTAMRDTVALIRAFARAKWEKLCPFVEWA